MCARRCRTGQLLRRFVARTLFQLLRAAVFVWRFCITLQLFSTFSRAADLHPEQNPSKKTKMVKVGINGCVSTAVYHIGLIVGARVHCDRVAAGLVVLADWY